MIRSPVVVFVLLDGMETSVNIVSVQRHGVQHCIDCQVAFGFPDVGESLHPRPQ